MEKLIRRSITESEAYIPILPLEVLEHDVGISIDDMIKLDGNENVYGCSPRVQRALGDYPRYHIYPDPEQRELRLALAEYVGLGDNHIVAGQGSDELIDLILRLFIEPGDKVINCTPTFGMYSFSTQVCGGKVVEVPRNDNFVVDVAKVKSVIDECTKVLFLASPNNPTGNTIPESAIRDLLDTGLVVVVDEAYYEFSKETVAPLVACYENLIVLRTFSKWAGLAGLRIGYGLFSPKIASYIMRIKQPYNVSVPASIAAIESLKDIEYTRKTVDAIIKERQRVFTKLQKVGIIQPIPSQANFLLCSVIEWDAKAILGQLKQNGIFVRHFDTPRLRNCLRISVGKPKHTDALIAALSDIKARGLQ